MTVWALVLVALVPLQSQPPESKPVPSDSFRITTTGCLKGRVFTSAGPRESPGVVAQGPDVTGRSFRLNGPKPVMKVVKEHNGHLVEVTGLVLKSALIGNAPGARIGNTRVVIGAQGASSDPMGSARAPMGGIPVLDASTVQFIAESCPIPRK
jgi:hypothetical protein